MYLAPPYIVPVARLAAAHAQIKLPSKAKAKM